ncbi:hypothetical protein AV530_013278 [Patagioenas fasciata monilis]|uniref:Uncharacterized protein n=1 Tax=Patagioenas fasciata monilis TaxID=372326 RepID=A0A1V4JNQ9_PATFA|nr:hypothetical protein AV530_013278 [Patagioenas fasciata monilis]
MSRKVLARLITMKKSLLTKTHYKCWTQLHHDPAPLCIHCPSSPLWRSLVQTSSHWETPVLKAAVWTSVWEPAGNSPGLLKSFSHPMDLL